MNLIDIHNNIYINTLSKTLITKVQNICHTDTKSIAEAINLLEEISEIFTKYKNQKQIKIK